MTLIIVFGVSGVGKTTLCKAFAARHSNFLHLTASALIAEGTASKLDDLRFATFNRILQNQSVLQQILERKVRRFKKAHIILDGQCVIDNGAELIVLPVETIAALHPGALILLEADPEEIYRRRLEEKRQRPFRSPNELADQIQINRSTVAEYASQLGIPYRIINAEGLQSLEPTVHDLINGV